MLLIGPPTDRTPHASRHHCLVYEDSPSRFLPALAASIQQHLNERYRCLYLHCPAMVADMHSLLLAGGTDVAQLVRQGQLVLSSSTDHLVNGRFHVDRMMTMLNNGVEEALTDGYRGLFATGDMSWEFGPDYDFCKLVEYEWQLEELFQRQPALSGICQYHANTLPAEVLRQGLVTHSSLYLNETLSRLNPYYLKRDSFTTQTCNPAALDAAIRDLCQMPDALMLRVLPPDYLR